MKDTENKILHRFWNEREEAPGMEREKMEQLLKLQSARYQKMFEQVQELYKQYYDSDDETYFTQLIALTDAIYGRQIRNVLKQNGCYSEDAEQTAFQNARMAIWEQIRKWKRTGSPQVELSKYCKGIYYHKAIDVVREKNTYRKHYTDKSGREMISLNEDLPEGNKQVGDIVEDPKNRPEMGIALDEQRKVFRTLFMLYCQSLVNAKAIPPRAMALYYARILPHVLNINHQIATIPESKMASAKWAFERMKDETMGTLGEKSEEEMKTLISQTLHWCDSFWEQMECPTDNGSGEMLLKDIVYTSVYGKEKIENWSESMHKAVAKATMAKVIKDSGLVKLATEYICDRDGLYNLVKGGKDK